jgi:ORF6N domain
MAESESIAALIITVRGQKVLLDSDLAALYGVTTKRFNEQVKRNRDRFPEDFMFQLAQKEFDALRSQNATSNDKARGGRRYLPWVFTEHGALMAANILNSPRAVQTSISVVRAFLRLRTMALSVEELSRKVAALESKYDEQFRTVFDAVRQLFEPPNESPKRRIGFHQ